MVDDEPFNLLTLKDMVKLGPYKELSKLLDTAINGKECIRKIKEARSSNIFYSLILMDLSMPIMDGYEATMQIRDLY